MTRLILVCGPTGAGKTSYSLSLAKEIDAVRFSIDSWMQTLFSKDVTSLNYTWLLERVYRCYEQIWEVSEQVLSVDGNVILDLGFTTKQQRKYFTKKANKIGITSELHYLDAPVEIRKQRVENRNFNKDPALYSFEVSETMFNFMETKFEKPDRREMYNGRKINT